LLTKQKILFIVLSGIALVISFFNRKGLAVDAAWVSIALCGIPIIVGAVKGLIREFDVKADLLVSMALVASVVIGEVFAAGEIAFIMQIGALLEELTVAKARAGIERLVQLTPRTARIVENDGERIVPADQARVGDVLRVLAGETIPADGVIIKGRTSIDQSIMTGESMPVDKSEGDKVSSGTVNQFGTFDMKAAKVGEDSSLQRMIRLVQSADSGKARIVRLADQWATWIVAAAISTAALTWIVSGEIIRAVTILVVFCPCALVLATPTAIMAAIGNASRYGILVREGDALERLAQVKKIAFDKTGTLTCGEPQVAAVKSVTNRYPEDELYSLVSSAELRSEHPLGKAIVSSYKQTGRPLIQPLDFTLLPGRGVISVVNGKLITAGNFELLSEQEIAVTDMARHEADKYLSEGCTVIYMAIDGVMAGLIALSDSIRESAADMVLRIKGTGLAPVLLTGDHLQAAAQIAKEAGITEFHAGCLPENKLAIIENCQKRGELLCMVGDGINDALALKKAHVGIAMSGIGSDVAVEAADIALVGDDISRLPHLFALSKRMVLTIKGNLTFTMALNFAAAILAMTGILNPVLGALVHNSGSVLVIINSVFLLKWTPSCFFDTPLQTASRNRVC